MSRVQAAIEDGVPVPTVKEVKAHFEEAHKEKSTLMGISIAAVVSVIYAGLFVVMLRADGWTLKLLAALLMGVDTCALFVVGHDACHQALTPRPWLNKLIGRITFLPSLHSYSHWDWGHNSQHHGWTNVRGKDPVFVPLGKAEYDQLSPIGKWVERFYRKPYGLGFYYLIRMWGAYAGWPMFGVRAKQKRSQQMIDWLLALGYFFAWIGVILAFGKSGSLGISPHWLAQLAMVVIGFIIPFSFWNAAMGWVIYQHHTHPEIPWFKDINEWTFFEGQVACVIHVELPKPIELILHNIMDHTAHHVDPKIPLYNLPKAQQSLEAAYPKDIKVVEWTFAGFRNIFRVCRLYDYENHRWIDYDGTPTSECHRLGRAR